MKCITRRIILTMFVFMVLLGGCKKKEESILPSANNVQETTNKTENTKVSEDIEIDKEYLEKKYPGKTVLTWVYTESENISKKERKKYNEPLGMKYITNNQVIKLNDYLTAKGKDYIICFKKVGDGKDYAGDIENLTKKGEAPDFIFSEWYLDEIGKQFTTWLTYDLIGRGMVEELSQYRDTYLKNYFSIMPENAIKLSSVNGKFYGYNEGIGELEIEHKWYVNVGLAKEYGIDLNKYKTGGYEQWFDAQIALGANMNQAVKAIAEAEAYPGPSLIIGYAPCELHGVKGGMTNCQNEMKKAVEAGYWNLFTFNPANKAQGKNPFTLTSKAVDNEKYQALLANETRYSRLTRAFPERAKELFARNQEVANDRYEHLTRLVELYK